MNRLDEVQECDATKDYQNYNSWEHKN